MGQVLVLEIMSPVEISFIIEFCLPKDLRLWGKFSKLKEFSLCLKLWFLNSFIFASQCQRFASSGCTDIGIRKLRFATMTQFLSCDLQFKSWYDWFSRLQIYGSLFKRSDFKKNFKIKNNGYTVLKLATLTLEGHLKLLL